MTVNTYYPLLSLIMGRVEPHLGRDQKYFWWTTPYKQMTPLIRPAKNSLLYMMTYGFPRGDWDDTAWHDWLRDQHGRNGLKTRVVGGRPRNLGLVSKLCREGLIDARVVADPPTTHLIVLTKPKMIWFEGYHRNGSAWNCSFTDKPDKAVYDAALMICKDMWSQGERLCDHTKVGMRGAQH